MQGQVRQRKVVCAHCATHSDAARYGQRSPSFVVTEALSHSNNKRAKKINKNGDNSNVLFVIFMAQKQQNV